MDDDEDFKRAIALSLNDFSNAGTNTNFNNEDDDLKKALEFSKLEAQKEAQENELRYIENERIRIEQENIRLIEEQTLNDYLDNLYYNLPKEPDMDDSVYVDINIKPSNSSVFFSRRFNTFDTIGDVRNFARIKLKANPNLVIGLNGHYTKKQYDDDDVRLSDSGIDKKETFIAIVVNEI
jgi:hypothetical protein